MTELTKKFAKNAQNLKTEVFIAANEDELKKILAEKTKNLTKVCDFYGKNEAFDESELINELKDCQLAINSCEFLIASSGSILISSGQAADIKTHIAPEKIIYIAKESQITDTVSQAIEKLLAKYGKLPKFVSVISGPSRTADIEKTLILGMHGPKEVSVIITKF